MPIPPNPRPPRRRRFVRPSSSGDSSGLWKTVIFVLIFVVGNIALFATTGFVVIPK